MIGAVDIGGTKIAVGAVDDNGKVLARAETPTDGNNYSAGLDAMVRMLQEIASKHDVQFRGIGIGSTGPVDPILGEFGDVDFLPGWRGKKLVPDLEDAFHVKAALENDGDAAALAEAGWGAGRDCARLIYITVRSVRAGMLLWLPRVLGIAGSGTGNGHVDRSERSCWISASSGDHCAEDLRTCASGG